MVKFNEALLTGSKAEQKAAAQALANAIAQKKAAKAYGNTLSKLQEVDAEYGDLTESSQEYSDYILLLGETLGLDMEHETNFDLVADSLDTIRQAAEGDVNAILAL